MLVIRSFIFNSYLDIYLMLGAVYVSFTPLIKRYRSSAMGTFAL